MMTSCGDKLSHIVECYKYNFVFFLKKVAKIIVAKIKKLSVLFSSYNFVTPRVKYFYTLRGTICLVKDSAADHTLLRACLVPKKFYAVAITLNLAVHVWSTKYRRKKNNCTVG